MAAETAASLKKKLDRANRTLEETFQREIELKEKVAVLEAEKAESDRWLKLQKEGLDSKDEIIQAMQSRLNEHEYVDQSKMTIREGVNRLKIVINSIECDITRKEVFKVFVTKGIHDIDSAVSSMNKEIEEIYADISKASAISSELRNAIRGSL